MANAKRKVVKKKEGVVDEKLKVLSPTLRDKKRFLRFRIEGDRKFSFSEISAGVVEELLLFMGVFDFGKNGVWILREHFSYEKQEIVIRCSLGGVEKLRGAMALIKSIGGENVALKLVCVSGTLKGCYKIKEQ